MRLSRFFCTGLTVLSTTSCSSMYDVWQGYDDIEPQMPDQQVYQIPSQERGELDEVVARATIDNNFVQSSKIPEKQISSANLEEIYKRAEMQAEIASLSYEQIPALPPISAEKSAIFAQASETTQTNESSSLKEDEIIDIEQQEPSENIVVNAGTIVIGGDTNQSESVDFINVIEQTESEFQPLVGGDDYSYSTYEEIGDTVVIGGEISTQGTTNVATYDDIAINDETIIIGTNENIQSDKKSEDVISGTNVLAGEIKYNKGSDRLSTGDVKKLRAIVAKYKNNPSNVLVIGYAINKNSNLGVDEAMALMDLANRRAEKVAANLVKHGVNKDHINVSADALDASGDNNVTKKDVTEIFFSY